MHRLNWSTVLALMACFVSAAGAQPKPATRPLQPEDIASIRWATHVSLSPDGKQAAYIVHQPVDHSQPKGTRPRTLWIAATDQSSPPRPAAVSHHDVSEAHWSTDGQELAFLSKDEASGKTQVWFWNAETDQARCITKAEQGVKKYRWSADGKEIAYKTATEARPDADPVVVESDEGRDRIVILRLKDEHTTSVPVDAHVVDFDLASDGKTIAAIVSDFREWDEVFREARLVTLNRDGTNVRELSKRCADFVALAWAPGGKSIAFMEQGRLGFGWRVATVNVETGEISHPLKELVATPMLDFQWTDSESLLVRVVEQTRFRLCRVNVATGNVVRIAEAIHGCYSFSTSRDGEQIAFTASDPKSPTYVEFLDREDGEPVRLTELNPHLKAIRAVGIRQVEWRNKKDGKTIYGVLLTPHDHNPDEPGRTVVLLHGGPQGVWWNSWVGSSLKWAQMLATHGYVVFLPNPRGSLGQSWRFSESVHGDWGGMDVQDVLDGIDMLVENKTIDKDRIGVGGWSYGGFLSASITTQTDRFKAAIVGAGIIDLPTYAVTVDEAGWVRRLLGGNEIDNRELYTRLSPLTHISKCKTPTLVLHGENDLRCPLDQGRAWYRGLQFLDVKSEMVVYPREGHMINERAHRIDMLKRVLDWYDQHLDAETEGATLKP